MQNLLKIAKMWMQFLSCHYKYFLMMSKPKGQKKTKLHTHSHVEATLLEKQAAQWQERIISANS